MTRLFLAGCVLLMCALAASAQTPEAIVSYDVGYFSAGIDPALGGAPIQAPNIYPASTAVCGLVPKTPAPVTSVTNPTRLLWDDPANTAADCRLTISSPALLISIPTGTGYRAALRARGATSVGDWSLLSNPFDVAPVPPLIPRNVRVQ